MKILDVYKQYRILPFLQLHQLRVAAVAQAICDDLQPKEAHEIVTACLLHDMGNLLKFDMVTFPDAFEPEGIAFWQAEQDRMRERYGANEHHATVAIAKELGVSERTVHIIDHIGFGMIPKLLEEDDIACMIAEYADMRVAPHGIVTMEERLEDGRKRYADKITKVDPAWHAHQQASVPRLQTRVFREATILPATITDAAVALHMDSLRSWEI